MYNITYRNVEIVRLRNEKYTYSQSNTKNDGFPTKLTLGPSFTFFFQFFVLHVHHPRSKYKIHIIN